MKTARKQNIASERPQTLTALSVRQPYAHYILCSLKTEEYRSWRTGHRGPLLIVSSRRKDQGYEAGDAMPLGKSICIVDVVDCYWNEARSCYAWVLENPRPVKAVEVKGRLRLFQVTLQLPPFD